MENTQAQADGAVVSKPSPSKKAIFWMASIAFEFGQPSTVFVRKDNVYIADLGEGLRVRMLCNGAFSAQVYVENNPIIKRNDGSTWGPIICMNVSCKGNVSAFFYKGAGTTTKALLREEHVRALIRILDAVDVEDDGVATSFLG